MNYYNEWDKYAAQWLRNLIAAGHLPPGDVDERDIRTVKPEELAKYTQCHFFAGIGGWSLALKLAWWPEDRPVWTGSCPCQPFSVAGKRKGKADDRHLWPDFLRLITECNPPIVFGEQVASADGRKWLAGVRADLEAVAYRVGGADLCAAGVQAPHPRQRLWWVADSECNATEQGRSSDESREGASTPPSRASIESGRCGLSRRLVNAECSQGSRFGRDGGKVVSAHEKSDGRHDSNPWAQYDLLPCADGKARRVEPGTFPLAHGVPARVGKLRAYGNAIVPQVAAEFIRAYKEL